MANKIASLQAQLERRSGRASTPEPANNQAPAPAAEAIPAAPPPKSSSREGKVHIGAYLPVGFQTSLLAVRAQTREDVQTVLARALNELFRAHNVPVVDLEFVNK